MNFSKTLRTLRKEMRLTQEQLASYLNISRSTIAGYETKLRQPDFETLQELADYFEVSIDFLITGENPIVFQKSARSHIDEFSLELEMKSIYQQLTTISKYDVVRYAKLLQLYETYALHIKK